MKHLVSDTLKDHRSALSLNSIMCLKGLDTFVLGHRRGDLLSFPHEVSESAFSKALVYLEAVSFSQFATPYLVRV